MFGIFLQEVVAKVAHLTVEAFVLSGSYALRPMPHNLSRGLASRRRHWPVCTRARRIFSFWENFARLPRRTKCSHSCCQESLPGIVIEVAYMTIETCLLSGIVSSK